MNKLIQSKTLYVSVLVCSFNGGKYINACLDSLNRQTYERENFEIIVVDDGSTDDTSSIAQIHGAHVIRFKKNRGIPVARNAGLFSAKGDIVVFIDDDCVADSRWLENLISMFKDQTIVAVGGKIIAFSRTTIAERYMEAVGYGNPSRAPKNNSTTLIGRLLAYFDTMISPIVDDKKPISVMAVYTANVAYRRSTLLSLGGFDESLRTSEDSDISARIHARGGRIVYEPSAIVKHRHYKSLFKVVNEPFRRAQCTLRFYLKHKSIPPLFPMPILYMLLSLGVILSCDVRWVIGGIFLFPLVLYSWWIVRGVRERRFEYVWYPYVQLVAESIAMAGFLKGLFGMLWDHISASAHVGNLKN